MAREQWDAVMATKGILGASDSRATWSPISWLQKPLGAAKTGSVPGSGGELGAAKPAPEGHSGCQTPQGRTRLAQRRGVLSQFWGRECKVDLRR